VTDGYGIGCLVGITWALRCDVARWSAVVPGSRVRCGVPRAAHGSAGRASGGELLRPERGDRRRHFHGDFIARLEGGLSQEFTGCEVLDSAGAIMSNQNLTRL
jgi:hypothetical protein